MDHLLGTPIPQVVDLSVQDAIELLNEEGIEEERIIIEEVLSDDVEKGNVVAVDPQPQQRLRSGENVTLQVSRGGHYVIENYVGMSVSQLRQLFEENGINIEIIQKEEARWDVSKGTILSQSLAVADICYSIGYYRNEASGCKRSVKQLRRSCSDEPSQ